MTCVWCKGRVLDDHDCRNYDGITDNTPNPRSQLLADAEALVNGDRNNQYGPPTQDFARTATMWGAYLGQPIAPHDVAALMSLLKLSRIRWSPEKHDHWCDLAGYAACGWDCVVAEGDEGGDVRCQTCGDTRLVSDEHDVEYIDCPNCTPGDNEYRPERIPDDAYAEHQRSHGPK